MRELQQLIIYTAADLPDMAHNQQLLTFAEYAYAAPNRKLQICSEGEKKPRIFPNIFTESRKLPEAARWEAVEDKEIASLGPCGIENHRLAVVLQTYGR